MALIKCGDCGKSISDSAEACPFCGKPMASASVDVNKELNKKENKLIIAKRVKIFLIIGFVIILLAIPSFFIIQYVQQKGRSDKFNSDLKEILLSDNSPRDKETIIEIEGYYADKVTFNLNTGLSKELNPIESDPQRALLQRGIYLIYEIKCSSMVIKRLELIIEYGKKEEYLKDKKFLEAKHNPYCTINTSNDKFEHYTDKYGNDFFIANGVPYESK